MDSLWQRAFLTITRACIGEKGKEGEKKKEKENEEKESREQN
jgi:hypothetical protein